MSECEGGHHALPLPPVLVALGKQDADAQDPADAVSYMRRLGEVIIFSYQYLRQCLGRGEEDPLFVEETQVPDKTIIGDCVNPKSSLISISSAHTILSSGEK